MDVRKFYSVAYTNHVVCNPLSVAKLDEFAQIVDLPTQARVVDIACGKAELLVRLAERYDVRGDGIDISPVFLAEARKRAAARVPNAALHFHEQDGAAFAATPRTYDIAICLGATAVFGGYRPTLETLARWVRPGGQIAVGEPFWRRQPDQGYFEAGAERRDAFLMHAENVAAGVELGFAPLYTLVASEGDWDRYEGLKWRAVERYAAIQPEDPDTADLLLRMRSQRDLYLRWERESIGWALYLFRV